MLIFSQRHLRVVLAEIRSPGTVALRRRASSPCLKVGTQAPQTPWRTVTNRAFECLLRGFWAGEWITSGDPNAQCNSARGRPGDTAVMHPQGQRAARSTTMGQFPGVLCMEPAALRNRRVIFADPAARLAGRGRVRSGT
jgi:hypothetical protein